jgi:hypothetical protein
MTSIAWGYKRPEKAYKKSADNLAKSFLSKGQKCIIDVYVTSTKNWSKPWTFKAKFSS